MPHSSNEFGEQLRKRRMVAGLSLTALSRTVHYSKAQLSKVERGIKPPSRELARLCDAALRAEGALVALLEPLTTGAADTPAAPPTEEEEWLMHLSENGPSWFHPVGRRQLIGGGAASFMQWQSAGQARVPAVSAGGVLHASRALFSHYRRLGQNVDSGVLLPGLIAQTHTLRELAAHSDAATRRELLTLGSRYAEYVGWLVQETGNDKAALWWTDRAVVLADSGGDQTLAGYALVRRALTTLYREDAAQTVSLARRAQANSSSRRVRGLAAQREAQGHALAGDLTACLRSLDRARGLLSSNGSGRETPVMGSMHLPDSVGMVTGWCLVDLGRPHEAAEVLDRQLRHIPSAAVRTRARYGVRRALAYATAGEIDHACELTAALLEDLAAIRSATVTIDLRRLARVLARYRGLQAVRDLAPRLGTLTHFPAH